MDWFFELDEKNQEFVKQFILSSGSLKHLAEEYGVSYPTVRLWVNQLIYKIENEDRNNGDFEEQILGMAKANQISLETAREIIERYHKENNIL
ncbi:DUF2089 family protein [Periweissella beninensis]|uniref:DUF2089 family protein n=1 Tax=Periweissella beninensis TaxID=504936 RepID=A0ABT0VH57_9LACO|nr:DUF2089 family protein [Periweissella beninensis]MBM7544932.1 hypothetical protein [Periweissella beninensis]MCM2437173.1 DUF2089 family protein [Periweissella beninensis]MCT4395744.1 DUF2089 family protein [Periweissella beninensis]